MITGIGVDIVEISRIEKAIARWGDAFLQRIFTTEEIKYARQRSRPAQHFAVRFAAKEAVFKAVGNNPSLGWKDILITNDTHGRPQCIIKGKTSEYIIQISLTHEKKYAVANAVITTPQKFS